MLRSICLLLLQLAFTTLIGFAKGSICKLPNDPGWLCSGQKIQSQFYYDVGSKQCKTFEFLGCGGNTNRFGSAEECQQSCQSLGACALGSPLIDNFGTVQNCFKDRLSCPPAFECTEIPGSASNVLSLVCCPSKESVCAQSVDRGSRCIGGPIATRFFYDPLAKLCREFTYLGCAGNDNNFLTKGECLKFCADQITCLRGDPLPQKASTRIRECDKHNPCSDGYECISRSRETACCPSRGLICKQKADPGVYCTSGPTGKRWYFDPAKSQCVQMNYLGCKGNLNNFVTTEQCQSFCLGTCPNNRDAYVSPETEQILSCRPKPPGELDACPVKHVCTLSDAMSYLCCRAPPRCPGESQPYIDPVTSEPVKCVPNKKYPTCPQGFVCSKGSTKEHLCCTEPITCPDGFAILRDAAELAPRFCSTDVIGSCPRDYQCLRSSRPRDIHVCCRRQKVCIVPYVDPVSFLSLSCSTSGDNEGYSAPSSECPPQTSCVLNRQDERHYCCYDIDLSFCADDGSIPYLEPGKMTAKRCKGTSGEPPPNETISMASADVECPSNFRCAELEDRTFGCCRIKPKLVQLAEQQDTISLCKVAYLDRTSGGVTSCKPNDGLTARKCPQQSFCRKASNGQFYCCTE